MIPTDKEASQLSLTTTSREDRTTREGSRQRNAAEKRAENGTNADS